MGLGSNEIGAAQGRREIERISGRFVALRDIRLMRLRELLSARRQEVLDLLPLLFHLNHENLPAFVGSDVPCGLPQYTPSRDTQHAARKHLRGESLNTRAQYTYVLRGIYLMGSSGSLGQDRDSDFDVWLCHDSDLDRPSRRRLEAKAHAVEAWAKTLGVEVHIFLIDAEGFRRGHKDDLSDESSGSTQHFLLLEEFYRTGLLLAGRPPLWWLVPPEEERSYDAWVDRLEQTQGLRRDEWIDFGPLADVPADEFFSSAHWQLHKGIDAPYKSILKLMLIEAYTAQYPHINWLADQLKLAVYGEKPLNPDELDPYRMVMTRVTSHLGARGENDRLELARRSLYIKSGVKLSETPSKADWRYAQMHSLTESWGWGKTQWSRLDGRQAWQLERVMEERDALVAELAHSYRMLTDFARAKGSDMSRNGRELSLLGRKLYAALERRPGKVDLINPGIARDLQQQQLWISRHASGQHGGHWRLYRQAPDTLSDTPPIRAATSLVEMLAWLYVNELANTSSQIQLLPRSLESGMPEHQRILQVLEKRLGPPNPRPRTIDAFRETPHAVQSLAFLNVAPPPSLDLKVVSTTREPARSPVDTIEHLMITSWGEILVRSLDHGMPALMDTLCYHLNMTRRLAEQAPPLYTHCFSSGAADAIAGRITVLSEDIADSFRELGEASRYVFELEGVCYLFEQAEDEYHWLTIGDRELLLQFLQQPQTRYRPVRLNPLNLQESPLVRIYAENIQGVVQVFYRVDLEGVEMFVLDDMGALFHQHYRNISEADFLSQQRRLFDSLANRRLLAMANQAGEVLAGETRFYRLGHNANGWAVRLVDSPPKPPADALELVLVTSREGLSSDNFTLVVDNREFDALRLGRNLYREVAGYVLDRRRPGADYPVRLTGVMPAGLEEGTSWTVHEMLHTKRRIELRLTRALREVREQRLGSRRA